MTTERPSNAPNSKIEAALEKFCEARFAGQQPDPEKFYQKHRECGPELRERIEAFRIAATYLIDDGDRREPTSLHETPIDDEAVTEMTLGDLRIIREIGRGGMARVFEAEQISLGRRVALKVLSTHLSFSKEAILKFRREAEAGGRQSHPAIVTTYTVGECHGSQYIAQ